MTARDTRNLVETHIGTDTAEAERRRELRFPSNREVLGRGIADPPDHPWRGRLRDVSCTGLGLELDMRLKRGSILHLEVVARGSERFASLCACVIHSTPLREGGYLVGCAVEILTDEEVRALTTEDGSTCG